jgi:transcriptional regulator with XRE-family HTH domain
MLPNMPELVTQGSRRLGGYLRDLRIGSGKTLEEVAAHLDQDKGTVSRYESGRLKPKWPVVVMLANFYDATDEQAAFLKDLYETARNEPKPVRLPSGTSAAFRRLVYETGVAWRMREIGGMLVPGLLQVEEYIQALGATLRDPEAAQPKPLGIRMKRQKRLEPTDERPLVYAAVIDEIALTRLVGGREVMLKQLDHILDVAEHWDNVTIQVVPKEAGDYGAGAGGMTLVDYDNGEPSWAYFESLADSHLVDNQQDVQRFAELHDRAARIALPPGKSIVFIRQQIEVLESK